MESRNEQHAILVLACHRSVFNSYEQATWSVLDIRNFLDTDIYHDD